MSCSSNHEPRFLATVTGQTSVDPTLMQFNDHGRPVTPSFLFRNRLCLQLSPRCPNLNKKSMWKVKKKTRFLSTGQGIQPSCHHPAIFTWEHFGHECPETLKKTPFLYLIHAFSTSSYYSQRWKQSYAFLC